MQDVALSLLDRIGLEPRDGRNLLIAVSIMTLILFVYTDAPLGERALAAAIGGLVSGLVFVVVTVLINVYKRRYWLD